jgi:hypothetical protein
MVTVGLVVLATVVLDVVVESAVPPPQAAMRAIPATRGRRRLTVRER